MSPSFSFPNVDVLRQVAERSLSVFFLYSPAAGRFGFVSPAFEEIWGREAEGVNEQLPWLLSTVHPEDAPLVEAVYRSLLTGHLRQFLEFRIRPGNGQEKWIHLTAYAILQDGQRHSIAGFAEDITHHKQNEFLANKYSVQKNGILEMLAHDLNGPLGIAKKLTEQLIDKARRSQPDISEAAGLIQKAVSQSIHLIHDLLEKEFLESSQAALKFQRIELVGQITSMLEGFERMDTDDHKHFELESSSPQIFVEVDQTKFLQALTNLVSNATKFTPKNGHISIRVQEEPQSLLIKVSDDGVGIPRHLQPQLFERFTKSRRPGLRGEETTGLGLSIVKRIIELHQGEVWVESEEHQGAAFFVRIPRRG